MTQKRWIGTVAYLGGLPAVLEEFTWSWGQMIQYNTEHVCGPDELVHYDRSKISGHADSRNSLVRRMWGDWLFQMDTDHSFEPDILGRMLHRMNRYNVDVLLGVYTYKMPPFAPVLFKNDANGVVAPILSWEGKAALVPCDSGGAGALLVRRSVFDRIRKELKEWPFSIEPGFSEDHSFFRRIKKLGIQAWFDPRIEANHLMVRPCSLEDYQPEGIEAEEPVAVRAILG